MIFLKIVDRIAFLQVYAKGTPYPGREFSSSQMETITDALRATAYSQIENFLKKPPERLINYKQREEYLLDQNAWDEEMTSQDQCVIEYDSPCQELMDYAFSKWQDYSQSDYDDRDVCVIPQIPQNTYWDPCFLCSCAIIYYSTTPVLPKANNKCFEMKYPGVADIYDPLKTGSQSVNTIHYWNEEQ